jgi:hypothetical protein
VTRLELEPPHGRLTPAEDGINLRPMRRGQVSAALFADVGSSGTTVEFAVASPKPAIAITVPAGSCQPMRRRERSPSPRDAA